MFINKWLVRDSLQKEDFTINPPGVCIRLDKAPSDPARLLNAIQNHYWDIPLAVLFPENTAVPEENSESFAEFMIRLFFQPSYYNNDFHPVVFFSDKAPSINAFLDLVDLKCRRQGLMETNRYSITNKSLAIISGGKSESIDLDSLIKIWQKDFVAGNESSEIHLIIDLKSDQQQILNTIQEEENRLKSSDEYSLASFLYFKQREIENYRHELWLRSVSEKNMELYLSIQKEERANGLKWYYHEYEILPLWYKKFGHILKVIMGKRSFKSLFRDNVKKYKD